MLFPGKGDFITCCFSGDSKWLVTAGTEPESNVVVWNWEKEKVRGVQNPSGMLAKGGGERGQAGGTGGGGGGGDVLTCCVFVI